MSCRLPICYPSIILAYVVAVVVCAGCAGSGENPAKYVQPSVAVIKFENRVPATMGWDLGSGMREVLVERLMRTGRYHVIERPEIQAVLGELKLQQSGLTRPQDKAVPGQIKNVQYLIKGTVTDFGIVGGASGSAGGGGWNLFGSNIRAVMGINLYVVEVESGEIIASQSIQESVHASQTDVNANYKNMAFGGSVFSTTPLGDATSRVIDRAVDNVTQIIASRPWVPRIAHLNPDGTLILNGGDDRGLKAGDQFDIFIIGAPIRDPDTGDIIAHEPGKTLGRLRITAVHDRYSSAAVLVTKPDSLEVGMRCRAIAK